MSQMLNKEYFIEYGFKCKKKKNFFYIFKIRPLSPLYLNFPKNLDKSLVFGHTLNLLIVVKVFKSNNKNVSFNHVRVSAKAHNPTVQIDVLLEEILNQDKIQN